MFPKDESQDSLLGDGTIGDRTRAFTASKNPAKQQRHQSYLFMVQAVFFITSLALFIKSQYQSTHCKDHTPMFSPALQAVAGTGYYQRFDGSFATPNKYKGTPSPDIDDAWESIVYKNGLFKLEFSLTLGLTVQGGVISISKATLIAVNASLEYSVELSEELGGGYMASVEVLHQLHCLNMLRQATYEDYYKEKAEPWRDSPQTLRYHLDHCIDNLRQKLMCDADTGILTYVWAKDHPGPFPDFSVQHKCRSFDAVKSWVTDHQLFITKEHGIERVEGAKELESPP